jgi:thiosulfate/3-mercaptopyruvate sulfurtransferase
MRKNGIILLTGIMLALLIIGCSKEDPVVREDMPASMAVNSCEGCHTNYQHLKAVHSPDTAAVAGGCGGDVPHYEPYDRVYMGGEGYEAFKATVHGKLACTDCHNGNGNTDNKNLAHSSGANFINHPSKAADTKCAGCHADIVARTKNSLHEQGWGQKRMVYTRMGLANFSAVPHEVQEGYDFNCGKCHGTCGDCHVKRPVQGGGGLAAGHKFAKVPDMRDVCVTCHVSRGGHAYLGVGAGTVPDVHLTKANFTCMNCHSKNEIHGDGKVYEHRYQMELMPECNDCHKNVTGSNVYHAAHLNTFNCQACHSQDYNNCGSCHIHGDGARIPSHMKFKIAVNPLKDVKPYKFSTVRQSLSAPDSWALYGVPVLANFAAAPTYKYTTPHNIQKWTSRTQVATGKACYDNCHIIKEGNNYRNKNLYLFNSDLLQWETEANKNIVVDGKLPSGWN